MTTAACGRDFTNINLPLLSMVLCLMVIGTSGIAQTHTDIDRAILNEPTNLDSGQSKLNSLRKLLDAMDAGLEFMGSEHKKVNLDAVIGTRLVEGQLSVLLKHLKSSGGGPIALPEKLISRISEIQSKAIQVSNMATPYVQQNQPHYYSRIGAIIDQDFWTLGYPTRMVDRTLVVKPRFSGESMHEKDSDDCLTEFFGTGKHSETCRITRHCWKLMTPPGYRYYSLSHQVFYLQIGQSYGCFHGEFLTVVDLLNAGFCANMLVEAESTAKANYPQDRRDLFMEQQALCGVLGYIDFFRLEWLHEMLSWQWLPRGCWGEEPATPSAGGSRRKREERQLADGCECHRTAVALGALVQYVRHLVEALLHA